MVKDSQTLSLNPKQKEAVLWFNSPLLILSGVGSGKTSVLAHKYAHLITKKNVKPSEILAITFSNKAAEEMRDHILELVSIDAGKTKVGTFYSHCLGILRNEIEKLGFGSNFVIYDEHDTSSLIKHILRELKIYEALYKGVASRISMLKANRVSPEAFVSAGDSFGFDEKLARVYMRYQYELKRSNALDFDDIVMLTNDLFDQFPRVLSKYRDSFKYLLIDEFQDTNPAQYALMKNMVGKKGYFCAAADDDQSIFKFKGSDARNISRLEMDFPKMKVLSLEQNFRNTENILSASLSIIAKSISRKEKKMWTDRGKGEKVCHYWFDTDVEEAKYIAKVIKEMYLKGRASYSDIGIFFRVNIQARFLEEALKSERIPYKIVGGSCFYLKKEIKDTLAYMRLCVNPHDNVSLRKVINYPSRGIGAATLNKIESEAKKNDKSLFVAIKDICKSKSISAAVKEKLSGFVNLIESIERAKYSSAGQMLKRIIDEAGYINSLDDEKVKNIYELVSSAEHTSIAEFLDEISLKTVWDDANTSNEVSLMTLHHTKGAEFPIVFIMGIEEGIVPYFKANKSEDEMHDERRLFYVGLTRSKDLLYLTGSAKRRLYSKIQSQERSRFIKEIPAECCKTSEKSRENVVKGPIMTKVKKISLNSKYKTGCRVKHPKWGVGVVRDCYGEGEDLKVMVNFPNVGIKRLALKFAQLERV